jgi:hypothetical protein
MDDPSRDTLGGKPPTFWQRVHSVLGAALVVQSDRNRQRDFSLGKPVHLLLLGLPFTALFVVVLFGVVQRVLYVAVSWHHHR